ncbi:MAG: histidine kinase [Flavobacteriia bacterium]|jgi:signal transduction histidine kinase
MLKFSQVLLFLSLFSTCFSQKKAVIDSLNNLDYVYLSNNLQHSQNLFLKNLAQAQKIKYALGEAASLNKLGTIESLLGDYKASVAYFMRSVKLYEKLKRFDKVATIYADIGYRIRYIDYNEGLGYFRKAIQVGEKYHIGSEMSAIYNNYGETIKNENIDSALFYYQKSLSIARKNNVVISIPFSLNKISEAYAKKRDFKKAFSYLNESDKYRFSGTDTSGIADNIAYRADIFYEIPQVDSAMFYYEKSLVLAKKTNYNSLERFCLERLADLYQRKGQFEKAFLTFKKFKAMEDSVLNGSVKNEMANLQVRYDSEKTKRELAENEIILENRKKWLLVSLVGISLLILVLFFVYRYQKAKRKNERKELELNKELEKTILEKDFADEKIRIARELHDNIGSHLTFMISSLDNLAYVENPEKKLEKVADLSNFGRLTMKDLRDTIWAMNHDGGSFEQLIARVSELRAVLPSNLFVTILSNVHNEKPLTGLQLLNCYRIIQEFIQNTIKYAQADQIKVEFKDQNDSFQIEICDNGTGFDLNSINFGNGILNMKRRCEDLSGKFDIQTSTEGTKVVCLIPF